MNKLIDKVVTSQNQQGYGEQEEEITEVHPMLTRYMYPPEEIMSASADAAAVLQKVANLTLSGYMPAQRWFSCSANGLYMSAAPQSRQSQSLQRAKAQRAKLRGRSRAVPCTTCSATTQTTSKRTRATLQWPKATEV